MKDAATRAAYPAEEDVAVGVFAKEGKATVESPDVWQIKSV